MYQELYITPFDYMRALTDAMEDVYGEERFHIDGHPDDISATAMTLVQGVGTFMTALIRNRLLDEKSRQQVWDKVSDYIKTNEPYINHTTANDTLTDIDDEALNFEYKHER